MNRVAVLSTIVVMALALPTFGSVPHIGPLVVVDATGKPVGGVVNVSSGFNYPFIAVNVALTVDQDRVALGVSRSRIRGVPDAQLQFESTDCSGTPFFLGPSATGFPFDHPENLLKPTAVWNGGVYTPDETAPEFSTIIARSYNRTDELGFITVCEETPPDEVRDAKRARLLIDLRQFTPPFSLR